MFGRLLLLSVFVSSVCFSVFAQNNQPTTPLEGFKGILGVEAGDFSFFNYNGSEIESKKLDEVFSRNKQDRDYFLSTMQELDTSMQDLVRLVFPPKAERNPEATPSLKEMSDSWNANGEFTTADSFLDAVNEYTAAKLVFQNKMKALTALKDGAFPSALQLTEDLDNPREITEIPSYGNLNFDSIAEFYNSRLTQLDAFLNNLAFGIIYKNNIRIEVPVDSGKALTIDHPAFKLTPAEIKKIQDEIKEAYLFADVDDFSTVNDFTKFFRRQIQTIIQEYGKGNRFRMALQRPDESANLIREIKRLQEIKWVRSVLRVKYGFPLGFPKFTWSTSWFNLDEITNLQVKWMEQPAFTDAELIEQERDLRNALRVADQKSRRLTANGKLAASQRDAMLRTLEGEDELYSNILDGDTTLIGKVGSVVNFVTGNRPSAEVLRYILAYVLAADLAEEKIIRKPGGQRILADRYKEVYFGNEDDAAYYKDLYSQYKGVFNQMEVDDNDPFGGPGGIGGSTETLQGQTFQMVQVLDRKQIVIENVVRPNQRFLANHARLVQQDSPAKKKRDAIDDILGGND